MGSTTTALTTPYLQLLVELKCSGKHDDDDERHREHEVVHVTRWRAERLPRQEHEQRREPQQLQKWREGEAAAGAAHL